MAPDGEERPTRPLANGTVVPISRLRQQPSATVGVEIFKIIDGQIIRIETVVGPRVPYGSVWY